MIFAVFDVLAWHCSVLQAFLADVQNLLLIVTTYKFTALKVNGIAEDILLYISNPKPGYDFCSPKGSQNYV